jgi:hypothetical protein
MSEKRKQHSAEFKALRAASGSGPNWSAACFSS